MTVSINQSPPSTPLALDPLIQEVLEKRPTNDYRNRRKRLEYILSGKVEEPEPKLYNAQTKNKFIRITQHTIALAIHRANECILDPSYKQGRVCHYYRWILEYADQCMKDPERFYVDGLPCHWSHCMCDKIIKEDTVAFSMQKKHGHKYYHMYCAERLNLI